MYSLWANLSLLLGLLIVATVVWFFLTLFGKAIFEDLVGAFIHKVRIMVETKRREKDKDHYVY